MSEIRNSKLVDFSQFGHRRDADYRDSRLNFMQLDLFEESRINS
jgi:hypothetical protein